MTDKIENLKGLIAKALGKAGIKKDIYEIIDDIETSLDEAYSIHSTYKYANTFLAEEAKRADYDFAGRPPISYADTPIDESKFLGGDDVNNFYIRYGQFYNLQTKKYERKSTTVFMPARNICKFMATTQMSHDVVFKADGGCHVVLPGTQYGEDPNKKDYYSQNFQSCLDAQWLFNFTSKWTYFWKYQADKRKIIGIEKRHQDHISLDSYIVSAMGQAAKEEALSSLRCAYSKSEGEMYQDLLKTL